MIKLAHIHAIFIEYIIMEISTAALISSLNSTGILLHGVSRFKHDGDGTGSVLRTVYSSAAR